ncbi:MAG: hypothetical protein A3F31_00105 [Candidatus Levybacteria bacterium RIFCSPHIGHO2_12_FULL_38_12]|nr:MAG: hypothetical protein A3F31_00105 [Candidatus Levybacteria bacterium RIFCSPHIGHO2_12_FULL_38_12]OGH34585.1 MAG: hypothetical protein A3A47_01485 [Candidatus Levybacteria bacterium RIFCSPLOWO2_01_FULL_37_20]OGH43441.1 MAG: hypothetical protein A3J14_04560 [Candidatus Levybacteria bacterium RIFCSPLOWO2_02_FULL_37_18]OGH51194.1 MAG: hypothetical protein A3G13_02790 [Candidatus Levybacteria bacterium RIFCSPLOWO2_12_FULL_37_7]
MKFLPILKLIKTTDDVSRINDELEILLASLYRVKNGFETTLKKSVSMELANVIKDLAGQTNKDLRGQMRGLLVDIQKYLLSLPVVKLTLAFSPSQEFVEKIVSYIRENMNSSAVIELAKDSSILGGAIISASGKYKDISLKKALEKTFEGKREIISKLT